MHVEHIVHPSFFLFFSQNNVFSNYCEVVSVIYTVPKTSAADVKQSLKKQARAALKSSDGLANLIASSLGKRKAEDDAEDFEMADAPAQHEHEHEEEKVDDAALSPAKQKKKAGRKSKKASQDQE
jgi:hypothetical protein